MRQISALGLVLSCLIGTSQPVLAIQYPVTATTISTAIAEGNSTPLQTLLAAREWEMRCNTPFGLGSVVTPFRLIATAAAVAKSRYDDDHSARDAAKEEQAQPALVAWISVFNEDINANKNPAIVIQQSGKIIHSYITTAGDASVVAERFERKLQGVFRLQELDTQNPFTVIFAGISDEEYGSGGSTGLQEVRCSVDPTTMR